MLGFDPAQPDPVSLQAIGPPKQRHDQTVQSQIPGKLNVLLMSFEPSAAEAKS